MKTLTYLIKGRIILEKIFLFRYSNVRQKQPFADVLQNRCS